MTASSDDLHRLVDRLPQEAREEAQRRLEELIAFKEGLEQDEDPPEEAWSGDALLKLAGSGDGPEDLSTQHDSYLDPAA